jgi:hypothetical protein
MNLLHECTDLYPRMSRQARAEGFDDVDDWFELPAGAGRSKQGAFGVHRKR